MELSILSAMDTTFILKIRLLEKQDHANVKDIVLKPPVELWNIDLQFGIARK